MTESSENRPVVACQESRLCLTSLAAVHVLSTTPRLLSGGRVQQSSRTSSLTCQLSPCRVGARRKHTSNGSGKTLHPNGPLFFVAKFRLLFCDHRYDLA